MVGQKAEKTRNPESLLQVVVLVAGQRFFSKRYDVFELMVLNFWALAEITRFAMNTEANLEEDSQTRTIESSLLETSSYDKLEERGVGRYPFDAFGATWQFALCKCLVQRCANQWTFMPG